MDLSVVDRATGQALQTWRHKGRLFLAGEPGTRYSLRVINNTNDRVLVVLSIDGVNVLTGETAGYAQRGYVFSPHQTYDVDGWRKSQTEIAAFVFAPLPQSYAARTGRPGDVGVIGMAVFNEKPPTPPSPPLAMEPESGPALREHPYQGASSAPYASPAKAMPPPVLAPPPPIMLPPAAPAPAPPAPIALPTQRAASARTAPTLGLAGGETSAPPQDEKLGTGHGAREWSVANIVSFERATPYPQIVRQVEYDTFDNLIASGVIPPHAQRSPHAFPTKPGGIGYVPDPPGKP